MNDVTQTELPPVDVSLVDVKQLLKSIPHRYPFMLLDRMVDVRYGHSATGIKNVTLNEPFFRDISLVTRLCRAC